MLFVVILFYFFQSAMGFLDFSFFHNMMGHLVPDGGPTCARGMPLQPCDENQLMLQLARLYVTSPDRVFLLITADSLESQCQDIAEVMQDIAKISSHCIPLSCENLYVRLYESLKFFSSKVCPTNGRCKIPKNLNKYRNCLPELHEEFLDCEGQADWFEKTNHTIVCKIYNEILDCYYIKAANLCGKIPAKFLRSFASEVIEKVIPSMCRISKALPLVKEPMPFSGNDRGQKMYHIKFILILIYFILFILFN